MGKVRKPKTRDEWQAAVNEAEFLLLLDSARKYGLVAGGPDVNIVRCEHILLEGKRRGIKPQKHQG